MMQCCLSLSQESSQLNQQRLECSCMLGVAEKFVTEQWLTDTSGKFVTQQWLTDTPGKFVTQQWLTDTSEKVVTQQWQHSSS